MYEDAVRDYELVYKREKTRGKIVEIFCTSN